MKENHSKLHFISILVINILCAFNSSLSAQTDFTIQSPNGKSTANIFFKNQLPYFSLQYDNQNIVADSPIGVAINNQNIEVGIDAEISTTDNFQIIEQQCGERHQQHEQYTETIIKGRQNSYNYQIEIRLYNNSLAIRYLINGNNSISLRDLTEFNLVGIKTNLTESTTESGYSFTDYGSFTSLTPLFSYGDNIFVTINEAQNIGQASKAKISGNNGKYTFIQSFPPSNEITTPWRYIVFGKTAIEMVENKHVIYSLNYDEEQNNEDYSWVTPGTVMRCMCDNKEIFATDTVKNRIDFCEKYGIKYVLLDAGWYGLGYSQENNYKSNPLIPIQTLNIREAASYGKEKGVGIVLYINQVAWDNYNNNQIFDSLSAWGISGIKLGFMRAQSSSDLTNVYNIIKKAAERQIIVNVHDEMRPTGVETTQQNLMTTEGIRGNEWTSNSAYHTMLLPFTRFMSGTADYTICFPGYPENTNVSMSVMPTTKGHQMALSIICFSPLQHIMWYGKPWQYSRPSEIEFFKDLPTVWDDYKILEGIPGEYFTIARRSGNKWYIATATNKARSVSINLDFLTQKQGSNARIFQDSDNKSVNIKEIEDLSNENNIQLNLSNSGGAAIIIYIQDDPSQITDNPEKPQPSDITNTETPTSLFPDDNHRSEKVWAYNKTIYIANAPDEKYKIIDTYGRMITSNTTNSDKEEVAISKTGIYIVILNNKTHKVFIN